MSKRTIELYFRGELIDSRIMQHNSPQFFERMWSKRYGQKMKDKAIEIRVVEDEPVKEVERVAGEYSNRGYLSLMK